MTFYGSPAERPDGLSLSAQLAWHYFFENGWAVTRTEGGVYIVTDESCDLATAGIYPDEESFITWLEETTEEWIKDDPEEYLGSFVSIKGLLSPSVIKAMVELISSPTAPSPTPTEKKEEDDEV